MKTALISGITGQDGSFLAEFLLQKGYEVHGILRRSSSFNTGRIEHLYFDEWVRDMKQKRTINLHYGDMTDSSSLIRIIQQVQPDEIYNLAAQSHVKYLSTYRNTPQRQMPSARCVCWKLSASSAWRKRQRFTKPPLRNFTVKYRKSPNRKQLLSIPAARTE